MDTIIGKTFRDQAVVIDEKNYVRCTFTNCELIYTGGDYSWVGVTFDNCKITITGNAGKTVQFMQQVGMIQPQPQFLPGAAQMPDSGGVH
jgi:hypothetical protein